MGLDTSHDCWHGAYSAFTAWRHEIAKAAGYQVLPVRYSDGIMTDTVMLEWHRYSDKNFMGEWDETPADPLHILFAHSDCEGVIKPKQAIPLADALEALLPKIEDGTIGGHIAKRGGLRACTEKFIIGLRAAAAAGEEVEFH